MKRTAVLIISFILFSCSNEDKQLASQKDNIYVKEDRAKESRQRRLARLDTLPSGQKIIKLTVKELKEIKNGTDYNSPLQLYIDSLLTNTVGPGASELDTVGIEVSSKVGNALFQSIIK